MGARFRRYGCALPKKTLGIPVTIPTPLWKRPGFPLAGRGVHNLSLKMVPKTQFLIMSSQTNQVMSQPWPCWKRKEREREQAEDPLVEGQKVRKASWQRSKSCKEPGIQKRSDGDISLLHSGTCGFSSDEWWELKYIFFVVHMRERYSIKICRGNVVKRCRKPTLWDTPVSSQTDAEIGRAHVWTPVTP